MGEDSLCLSGDNPIIVSAFCPQPPESLHGALCMLIILIGIKDTCQLLKVKCICLSFRSWNPCIAIVIT